MEDAIERILTSLQEKINTAGKAVCISCMVGCLREDIAQLGVYIPDSPSVTGKTRLVAYPVCLSCSEKSDEEVRKRIERNIICAGVMLDPRDFSKEQHYPL